ncbi:hypothetical protein [Calothrix sp. NIES-2098]|uniref:hypothetical protein n=1 Tax=Calothrix sp. NIES-2098 TaxID=1954171 RepID=UPI000B5E4D63|nr:hypothetical protein NIES2098_35770 [Calothrix sp. NIES-2098]
MTVAEDRNINNISTTNASVFYLVNQFQASTSAVELLLNNTKNRGNPNEVIAILDYMKHNFIGTGGYLSINSICSSAITINASWVFNIEHQNKKPTSKFVETKNESIYDIGELLSVIRSSLSLNMKEMSQVIQVERQTVYSWLGGTSEPNSSNRKRINQIFQIAQRWKTLSSKPIGGLVRQSYKDGKNLVTMLSEENISREDVFAFLEEISKTALLESSNKTSIRELASIKGLKIQESTETIDWLTGKRIDLE